MKNKDLKRYYNILKNLFGTIDFREGKFLRDFKEELIEYELLYPDSSFEEISDCFGSPADIFTDYLKTQDLDYITKRIIKKNIRKYLLISTVAIILIASIMEGVLFLSAYSITKNTIVTEKEIIIDPGE